VRIETLLVANRGEIARRIIRSARAMGIRCVAVYVDADARAPFVTDADEAIRLAGSYLDAGALLEAARLTGVDAIHPGYGFLSENAGFAARVKEAGIAFVGPSPEAIERMGDKLAAKALAREVGVPTLPSAEDPAAASQVGYPLLVKAAAGGGGKGMRIVARPEDLAESVAAARRPGLSRTLRAPLPTRRDPDPRRSRGNDRPSRRTRMLDPTPPPEGARRVSVSPGRWRASRGHGRGCAPTGARARLPVGGNRRVPARR
jgi:formate-dependent phosphoribosylglycinamide formyltransferase (GAR transformylase)